MTIKIKECIKQIEDLRTLHCKMTTNDVYLFYHDNYGVSFIIEPSKLNYKCYVLDVVNCKLGSDLLELVLKLIKLLEEDCNVTNIRDSN